MDNPLNSAFAKVDNAMKQRLADELPHCDAIHLVESGPARLARLKARRKLWLDIHLWLGLSLGLILSIIGLTGSILVFYEAIDAALNPQFFAISSAKVDCRPLEEIVAAATTAIPQGTKLLSLSFPSDKIPVFQGGYERSESEVGTIYVDPCTAKASGPRPYYLQRPWSNGLIGFLFALHDSLSLNISDAKLGTTIVGYAAILLLFSVFSGLILWWPLTGKYQQALTFKRRASVERFNFDLHNTSGFYFSLLLLILLFSGVWMYFQQNVESLIGVFFRVTPTPQTFHSTVTAGQAPLNLQQALAVTDQTFPDGDIRTVIFPADDKGVYKIYKRAPDEVAKDYSTRSLVIDQYTGKVLYKTDRAKRKLGDIIIEWLYPLHSGEAFNMTGRIIVCVTGLIPTVLLTTGIVRWLQKRRAKQRRALRSELATERAG